MRKLGLLYNYILLKLKKVRRLSQKNNEKMEFVQSGGEGSNTQSKLFGIHFCSIEIQIWRWYWAIDTYFWIQTLGDEK